MNEWERTIGEMEDFYEQLPFSEHLYDLLLARYGFIPYCIDNDMKRKARYHLKKANEELEELMDYRNYKSNAYALRGAFIGFEIGMAPLKGITLGPKSYTAIDNSIESNPDNPVAWMEKANTRFYTPATFGGSKKEAAELYAKAVSLFEQDLQSNHKWLYLNTLVGLSKSYQYLDKNRLAVATLEKALAFEPGFIWVKEDLLPEAKKR
jgi:tetratricopeptide (TPR) repeat protein